VVNWVSDGEKKQLKIM